MAAEGSQAAVNKMIEQGQASLRRLDVPTFNASSISTAWAGNDLNIIFGHQIPFALGETADAPTVLALATAFTVNVSPHTAKDLLIVLADAVTDYEREWGQISTPYMRRREQFQQEQAQAAKE